MSTHREIARRLWIYVRPDVRYLVAAVICAAGVSGMSLLVGLMLKPFVDALNTSAANRHVTMHDLHQINRISLAIVGIYAVRWFFTYGQSVFFAESGQRLGLRLRNDIYTHLQGLDLGFFNRQRTGALMSTINNDLPILQGTISGLKDMATAPFLVVGGLIAVFRISPTLTLAALFAFPLMALTINSCTRLIRSLTSRTQDKLADVNSLMAETLGGIRIIQSFSAEMYEIGRFRRENQAAKDLSMMSVKQTARLKPTIDLIGAGGIALALCVAGNLVVRGQLTLSSLMTFIFMLNQVAIGVSGLGGVKGTWESVIAAGERIWDNVLSVQSEIRDAPGATALTTVQGTVELRHVAFSYHAETPVLRDISFTIHPGEVVALVGLSGAGKSTVADLIPRFYDPREGAILVDGHDIRSVTLESLRRQIGIVPQETVLFGGTIRDNIAYGNPEATEAMIEAAATAANAHHFICNPQVLPDGYRTLVGERGKQLSGGQRQRIAIARALLKNPRILILDEATSSLDAESEHLVQKALDELMKGRTTLVIAHRLSTIINASKIVVLKAGRIVEMGTHHELIQRPGGDYAELYRKFAK